MDLRIRVAFRVYIRAQVGKLGYSHHYLVVNVNWLEYLQCQHFEFLFSANLCADHNACWCLETVQNIPFCCILCELYCIISRGLQTRLSKCLKTKLQHARDTTYLNDNIYRVSSGQRQRRTVSSTTTWQTKWKKVYFVTIFVQPMQLYATWRVPPQRISHQSEKGWKSLQLPRRAVI